MPPLTHGLNYRSACGVNVHNFSISLLDSSHLFDTAMRLPW